MKKIISPAIIVLVLALFQGTASFAQKDKPASPREKVSGKTGNTSITIDYGSPAVKGRKIWGDLVPYGKVWRTGANEATTVEFSHDVMVADKSLPAGKYAFFAIPTTGEWTLIFNKTSNQWGAYDYDEKQDALRIQVKPQKADFSERLKYTMTDYGFALRWENLAIPVRVK